MDLEREEYPLKVDLRKEFSKPLPIIPPGTVDPGGMSSAEASLQAQTILDSFNSAVNAKDIKALSACFYSSQAYWRDMLALTWYLRTFATPEIIASALLETNNLRGVSGGFELKGEAKFTPATPVLQFIECKIAFRTSSPAASCEGRLILLPTISDDGTDEKTTVWKIWFLTTWIENLDLHPEDETLLGCPSKNIDGVKTIETEVLIIGGGNSGITLAARLKALGIDSVMVDKNKQVGDNWMSRYECLTIHLSTASCEMPFLPYEEHLQSPHYLTRAEVADQLRRYVATFNLKIISSATIMSSLYDESTKRWTIRIRTSIGEQTVVCKELVQATGIGTSDPYKPPMSDSHLYNGIDIHAAQYKRANLLTEQGVKSVAVIGSADTAFDIAEDCYNAGLKTTMVVRSPTYVIPAEYTQNAHGTGAYNRMPVKAVDEMMMTMPLAVESQMVRGLFGHLASLEPDRYRNLAAAGFPVRDCRHPDFNLSHHLIERRGGHHLDLGEGVRLISESKIGVRGGVTPVAHTATGLRFSDGSTIDVDAIVWCTGYAGRDARTTVVDILGDGTVDAPDNMMGPQEVAERLDSTWGVDSEGEIRGMWKRQLRVDHYWLMGGVLGQQRWWSRILAQQIKLALHGTLPPAYRHTPEPLNVV